MVKPGYLSGLALGYRLDDRGFESRQRLRIFLFITESRPVLWANRLPIQRVSGALSLEIKRPGRENDLSPPCIAEVTNAWSCTSTPHLYDVLLS